MLTSYDGMGNSLNDSATYNAAGRLNSLVDSGLNLNLHYNGLGELARTVLTQVDACTGARNTLATPDYDAWGNVTWSEQTVANGATSKIYATSYQYDGNSQLTKITYPSGRVVDYTRHPNGQIKDVKVTFNGVTTTVVALANYEPFVGSPQSIGYGNGMTQLLLSDTASAPAVYFLFDATTSLSFEDQTYAVANTGDITQVRDNLNGSNTRNYQYDNLDRLTWDSKASATNPTYTYDANGNRLTRAAGTYAAQSFTYNTISNREENTSYDGMGNSLNDSSTYNAAGRLNSVVESGNTLNLNYNGLGELARTALTQVDACSGAITTLATDDFVFTPDGRALYLRTTNTVATGTDYVWLDNLPVAQFQDSYDTQGTLISTEVTYLHADHLGTPRIGTNASRQVTWRNRSDAFGLPELSGTAVVRLRFPGQLSLGTSGLNYNYYRDYEPDIGRYRESDPIGLGGGLNTFEYVGANPLLYADPWGLARCVYSIGDHALSCVSNDGDTLITSEQGLHSGLGPCRNNTNCENAPDLGPVPSDTYNITANTLPGREGWWALQSQSWRPNVDGVLCRLGLKRCGFNIHLGTHSLGCITFDKTDPVATADYNLLSELFKGDAPANTLTVIPNRPRSNSPPRR